ncbi:MAG: ABC transporter permease [Actinomycetota bacterium]|nr:ABC transporter permease [Actinomycetota bacterium]
MSETLDDPLTVSARSGPQTAPDAPRRASSRRSEWLSDFIRHPAGVLFVVLAILCIWLGLATENFFTRNNWIAIGLAIAFVGIAAVGQTIAVVSGGLDLSQESVIAFTSVVIAQLVADGMSSSTAIGAALVIGTFIGLVNGVLIAYLRVNPVIATLGSMTFIRGFARVWADDTSSIIRSDLLRDIGLTRVFGIPLPVIIMLVCIGLGSLILSRTVFGRNVYFMGDNIEAARLAGIRVPVMQLGVYALCGFFAAVAGVIFAAKVGSGLPFGANGASLTIITAVILGGASLSGGIGRVSGTVIGVLTLGVIDNGLILVDVANSWQSVILGLILVTAVALDQVRLRVSGAGR